GSAPRGAGLRETGPAPLSAPCRTARHQPASSLLPSRFDRLPGVPYHGGPDGWRQPALGGGCLVVMAVHVKRRRVLALVVLVLSGCATKPAAPAAPSRPYQGIELVLGALGDPKALEAVAAQRGEWAESQGTTVQVQPGDPKGADVLIFPGDRLGELVAAKVLIALSDSFVEPAASPSPSPPSESDATPERASDPLAFSDVV